MDAKQACDKLNGFNFQSRYLVGKWIKCEVVQRMWTNIDAVLYHQPEKMLKSNQDLEARKENLEQLKKHHGIE
jgi:pre-mRNA branch site protein p14